VIEAVIFDMDGVLYELNDEARLSFLSGLCAKPPEEIYSQIWLSGFEAMSDAGKLGPEEYLQGFGRILEYDLTEDDWIQCRASGTIPLPRSLELAEQVCRRIPVALLTNNGLLLKRTIDRIAPKAHSIFGTNLFVSAEFGTTKPDPSIYLSACARLHMNPRNVLMVDDREENIEGAYKVGMSGHHFSTPELLHAELLRLKVFSSEVGDNLR